jgi:hypothetical protein
MSPEPYGRGQVLVVAFLLVLGAVLGSPIAVLAIAGVGTLTIRGLYKKYRGDVPPEPPRRTTGNGSISSSVATPAPRWASESQPAR